jgi:NADPH2:quinone reductase
MMKAVQMTACGGPEVLSYEEVPNPSIQNETEVLIKLMAAGINPVDAKQRQRGTWYPSEPPNILGLDGAGIVEEIAGGVRGFKKGDEVYFAHGGVGKEPGKYAEYAIVPERFVAPKPKSISFVEAAAAPSVLITAWDSLFHHGNLKEDQSVLIHAGAGGVGHVAVQLARSKGAKVYTTVAGDQQVDFVRKLGVENAIDYQKQDFVAEILDRTHGDGVDLVIDLVGKETLFKSFSAVRCYGQVVALLKPEPEYADWKEARLKNLKISYELMLTPMYFNLIDHQIRQTQVLTKCARLFDENQLSVHVSHTFPLPKASDAHRQIERGDTTGKIVLLITPP